VLALMPGSGDSIQALKAGVMEIPDVIVVNKCEHPLADTMVREVRTVLALGPERSWRVPVVKTEATKGDGIPDLAEAIEAHHRHIVEEGTLEQRRARNLRSEVIGIAAAHLRRDLERRVEADADWGRLLDEVTRREIDPASAARRLLEKRVDG
jgi:LAO/AO transport system kinase